MTLTRQTLAERLRALRGVVSEATFVFQVERVQPGCTVPRGQRIAPLATKLVIGRSSEADVVLDDVSVSRLHCEVRTSDGGFAVRGLTRSGSTFVNSQSLAEGEEVVVRESSAWLQIGRILLRATLAPSTMPVYERMDPPVGAALVKAMVVVKSGKPTRVWLGGQPASIFPSAARVLARLCDTPGATVTHDELMLAVDPEQPDKAGGAPLPQLVTYVRDAFSAALDAGWLDAAELRQQVLAADGGDELGEPEADPTQARRALLRALVSSKRGLGYVLRLPAAAIVVQ